MAARRPGSVKPDVGVSPASAGPICLGGVRLELPNRADFTQRLVASAGDRTKPLFVCFVDTEYLYLLRRREVAPEGGSVDLLPLPAGAAVRERIAALGCWDPELADEIVLPAALSSAAAAGLRIGVLSRSREDATQWLRELWPDASRAPAVRTWLWDRPGSTAGDPASSIREAGVDVLLVDMGRPVQEAWIELRAAEAGAGAYIGRVAVPAGRPWGKPIRAALSLARSMPRAVLGRHVLATNSHVVPEELTRTEGVGHASSGMFVGPGEDAEVCALAVTYRSAEHVDSFIDSLRSQAVRHRIRVVVVDNHSDDGTFELLNRHADVVAIDSGANLGYAGALNLGRELARPCASILVLNPDLVLGDGALSALLERLRDLGGGAVFPRILDDCGALQQSLRREPTWLRALGDGLFGSAWPHRPSALSELVLDPRDYDSARPVDWATGATMLVDSDTEAAVGRWDEQFFLYSEEVDYCRRIRTLGRNVWYEPAAIAWHHGGGSSTSPALVALLAVNRVRYVRKWHGRLAGYAFRLPVALGELRRSLAPAHRTSAAFVLGLRSWNSLLRAERPRTPDAD